jgi:DNA-binding GntR family transcriptional regulator
MGQGKFKMIELIQKHSTKTELVYRSLVDAIVGNKILPGTRLIVKDIAQQLSVSQIPVREALRRLESTSLIEMKPYAGAIVARPSPEWVEEVFVIRAALEGMALRTSIPKLSKEDIEDIIKINELMKECTKVGDSMEYSRLNRKFHRAIIGKCPYPSLLNLIDDFLMKSQFGRAIFGLNPKTMDTSDVEHEELIRAIQGRDADNGEMINRNHRLWVGKELSKIIRTLQKE